MDSAVASWWSGKTQKISQNSVESALWHEWTKNVRRHVLKKFQTFVQFTVTNEEMLSVTINQFHIVINVHCCKRWWGKWGLPFWACIANYNRLYLQDRWSSTDSILILCGGVGSREERRASELAVHVLDDWRNLCLSHGLGYHPALWWVTWCTTFKKGYISMTAKQH